MNNFAKMTLIAVTCLLSTAVLSTFSHAASLGLVKSTPDFYSSAIYVAYDSINDLFTATGQTSNLQLQDNGPTTVISLGTFQLSVDVDSTGNATAGTLTIGGTTTLPGESEVSGDLVTAQLKTGPENFGFGTTSGTYDLFEFRWNITGGVLADTLENDYGAVGLDTILDANFPSSNFQGNFDSDFSNSMFGTFGIGNADSFVVVPSPQAVWSGLIGLSILSFLGRKKITLA